MSQFMPESTPSAPSSVVTPQASVASDADVALMLKVFNAALARPDLVPEGFMAYVQDFIQTSRLTIPIGQIIGFAQFLGQSKFVNPSQSTTSTSFTDLATVGPELLTLPDGKYVVAWGCTINNGTGGSDNSSMVVYANGTQLEDPDGNFPGIVTNSVANVPACVFAVVDMKNSGNNSLVAKYKVSAGTGNFGQRWLFALKIANP